MARPPDHAARERALDPARSFIVQAPAGSGKTELLVRRYLTLLAHVDAPEKILAITFTKKATAEMRARVLDALQRARVEKANCKTAGGNENEKTAAENAGSPELLEIAAAALANDARRKWNLRANTRRLQIHTIDAFCNELVRRMPWSARFGAPPEVMDAPAQLHRRAAKRALDRIEEDEWESCCAQLLELADADWPRARDLLAAMLEKRGQWMPLGRGAGRESLERMWGERVDAELQHIDACFAQELRGEIMELAKFAAENIRAQGGEKLAALRESENFPGANAQCVGQWHALADFLLTQSGALRKRVTKTDGFPPEKKLEKEKMQELLAQLQAQPGAADALAAARRLPNARFGEAEWKSVSELMKLLRLTVSELYLLFTEQNRADFTELTQRAEIALGDEDRPSDLALVFDHRIEHLLMDEFQDTSTSHIELLAGLTRGWQRGDGRTAFFVGDPMQSIYRFREAEVANFLHVREHGLGMLAFEPVALQSNFRSAPPLVEWFNRTFQRVLPKRDDIAESAVRYTEARAHAEEEEEDEGGVHVHAGIGRDARREADAVAAAVEETLQREKSEHTIAVLGRARAHLHEVAAALRRRGVAFQAVDLEKLGARPAIRDLTALTRALVQPADRIAWLSVLRAPWCGMTLADLAALAAESERGAPLPELWRDEKRRAAMSEDGRARLRKLRGALDGALARRGRTGMRQNVEAAWLALGGPAAVESRADLDDCHRYLDLIAQLEDARMEITAGNLAEASENLWARAGGEARVQLLTIHKAKGLEFDSVFLPGLGRGRGRREDELLRWEKLPGQLLIAPFPSSTDKSNPFYRYLAHLDALQERNEDGRLLYVACTRARKHLHLFGGVDAKDGEPSSPRAGSLLELLWPLLRGDFANAARHAESEDGGGDDESAAPGAPELKKFPTEWSPPELPAGIETARAAEDAGGGDEEIEFSWAGEIARARGVVIHEILQHFDADAPNDDAPEKLWRRQLAQQGVPEAQLDAALAHVAAAVDNARRDEKAAWIFSRAHSGIRAEWPLTGMIDGAARHVVIDRSFIDENGVRWIIDFKSGRHEGGDADAFLDRELERHERQLRVYLRVVRQLEEKREVRAALYFPALCGWRELKSAQE